MSRSKKKRGRKGGSTFGNSRKEQKLASLHRTDLEADNNNLTNRCKFNFSYLDATQEAGSDLSDLSAEVRLELLRFLKDIGADSLEHWKQQKRFVEYGDFPPNQQTDFVFPRPVPEQARWSRFRINSTFRLVGFTVPPELDGTPHQITGMRYDKNTFYIVFLDEGHRFWKTEKKNT